MNRPVTIRTTLSDQEEIENVNKSQTRVRCCVGSTSLKKRRVAVLQEDNGVMVLSLSSQVFVGRSRSGQNSQPYDAKQLARTQLQLCKTYFTVTTPPSGVGGTTECLSFEALHLALARLTHGRSMLPISTSSDSHGRLVFTDIAESYALRCRGPETETALDTALV